MTFGRPKLMNHGCFQSLLIGLDRSTGTHLVRARETELQPSDVDSHLQMDRSSPLVFMPSKPALQMRDAAIPQPRHEQGGGSSLVSFFDRKETSCTGLSAICMRRQGLITPA